MKLSPEQLRAVQLTQLACMVEIDRICREQGFRYYLIGGTLLGAVRHKGFIPWDDDLDIAMPRDDYDRFMADGQDWLGEKYFLQNYNTDTHCYVPFSKIRRNDTVFREKSASHLNCHHGIYVDIFPLDAVSVSSKKRKFDSFVCAQLQRVVSGKLKTDHKGNKALNFIRRGIGLFCSLKFLDKLIYRRLSRYAGAETGLLTNALSPYGVEKEMRPVADYGEPIEIDFEGYRFFAPAKAEALLKQVYGNYMKLPPESERGGWHSISELRL